MKRNGNASCCTENERVTLVKILDNTFLSITVSLLTDRYTSYVSSCTLGAYHRLHYETDENVWRSCNAKRLKCNFTTHIANEYFSINAERRDG